MGLPAITCIMPTCNRRALAGQAIQYFLRQDYPSKELIVLDDGETPVSNLAAGHREIRYIRLPERTGIAAKRRIGVELASGELVAHWDDDDWASPQRLRYQVEFLLTSGADACGLSGVWHYDLNTARAWLFKSVADGTLVYWRSTGAQGGFGRVCSVEDNTLYVGLIHGANAALRSFVEPCWQKNAVAQVLKLLDPDREFYLSLRTGGTPTAAARETLSAMVLAAHFDVSSGYGSMAEHLALGLANCGADIRLLPLSLRPQGLTAEFLQLPRASQPDRDQPAIYYCWPRPELERFTNCRNLFINTMWESDELPPGWAAALNRARAVFAPSQFVADTFRRSGVTVPVEVIPEGLDPAVYHYIQRPERKGLTTLTIGAIDERKHVREGIAAWKKAFAGDPAARLIIKTTYGYHNYTPDDARIVYVDQVETTRGIAHWYAQADILLALGSEGFGLPAIEAMATGLPVVAMDAEGQADVCRDAAGLLLPVHPASYADARDPNHGLCGKRAVPDVDEAAAQLRWVAEHRDQAQAMGRAASAWAIANRSVWQKAPAILDAVERLMHSPRKLRREIPIWAPSYGSACGIAEYSADLASALPAAKILRTWPVHPSSALVHVQHEYSLTSSLDLERRIREARMAGVRVVITQHTVVAETSRWQEEADALVALTSDGAGQLRRLYPGKRVEHIPHGCHGWFPPRKKKIGRVIGLFGFLEHYKGFFQVLDALRQLPDCDVLAFTHAKTPALEAEWKIRSNGLPVRRIGEFLPAQEVARRLAAEADILVFWYDEAPFSAASGAAAIGLASGVPVLTSRTGWFADLKDSTLQTETVADGIARLLDDVPLRGRLTAAAQEHCYANSWQRTASRHLELWRSVEKG